MFQLLDKKFILVRVSGGFGCWVPGGWISWNYNQLSQAKAEAETEFGNKGGYLLLCWYSIGKRRKLSLLFVTSYFVYLVLTEE